MARQTFEALRVQLGMTEHPPPYDSPPSGPIDVVQLSITSRGMPNGIWAFSKRGLAKVPAGQQARDVALDFIQNNAGLWGITSAQLAAGALSFTVRSDSTSTSPDGHIGRHVELDQRLGGLRVLDGGLSAIFWGDILTSISGPIFLSGDIPDYAQPTLPASEVRKRAEQGYAGSTSVAWMFDPQKTGLHSDLGPVTKFLATPTHPTPSSPDRV